jgi:hypothetical protein
MFDNLLTLSYNQSLVGVASTTAQGTYELDFETATNSASSVTNLGPDKGMGSPLVVRFVIGTTFTVATSVSFALCFDTVTKTGGGPTVVVTTPAIPIATLIQGYVFELKVPDMHAAFMNVLYTTVGTPGAGTVTAYMDIATGLRHR